MRTQENNHNKRRGSNDIATNYQQIVRRVHRACKRSGREPESVKIVAISKGQSPVKISDAVSCGINTLGESRPQEFREKQSLLADYHDINWHFVGHLQENKVRFVVGQCELIHSVDSLALADALANRSRKQGVCSSILLQVNVSREETKHGVLTDDAPEIVEKIMKIEGVELRGLMCMAPHVEHSEQVRPIFRQLRELSEQLNDEISDCSLDELSMGMSNDFEVAVEEGATLVRVGQAIFGPRDA